MGSTSQLYFQTILFIGQNVLRVPADPEHVARFGYYLKICMRLTVHPYICEIVDQHGGFSDNARNTGRTPDTWLAK